jgi:hypothetical protein
MDMHTRSIPDILMHLVRQLTELVRSEGQLVGQNCPRRSKS